MLEDPHRPGPLAEGNGHFLDGQSDKDPEQDHLCLVGRECLSEDPRSLDRTRRGEGLVLGVGCTQERVEGLGVDGVRRTSARTAPMLDEPPVSDREEPCPKGSLVTFEGAEAARGGQPGLRSQVLGLAGACAPKYRSRGALRSRYKSAKPHSSPPRAAWSASENVSPNIPHHHRRRFSAMRTRRVVERRGAVAGATELTGGCGRLLDLLGLLAGAIATPCANLLASSLGPPAHSDGERLQGLGCEEL